MDLGLEGKRALIAGASKGIGRAVAEALAAEGCRLVLVARTAEGLAAAAEAIRARPAEVADLVAFLVSPRAAYISGTIVTVDGGAVHRNH